MPYAETESDDAGHESFLTSPVNSDDFTQSLLRETSESFQNWLGDLQPSPSQTNTQSQVPKASREITFEGTLRVDGYMAGVIRSDHGTLILTEGGEIDGDVFVDVAMIRGSVRGDIRAAVKVELDSASRVIGDIETVKLVLQPGAVFEGRCALLPSPPNLAEPAADVEPEPLVMTATS